MASNTLIGSWATGVWQNIGFPTSISALTISGFAVQPNTLGTLNTRIGSNYSGTGYLGTGAAYDTSPDITSDELAIIEGLFLINWYNQLAFATMGAGGDSIPWTRIKEEGMSVDRERPANIGKIYFEMAKQTNLYLNYLVNAYVDGKRGTSLSVDYLNPAYPFYSNNAYGLNMRALPGPGIQGYP